MKRLFLAYAWLLLATGAVLTSIGGWYMWGIWPNQTAVTEPEAATETTIAAAQTGNTLEPAGQVMGVQTLVEVEDARPHLVANFLERYNSPLQPYDHFGQVFVDIADKYEIDFRLLPAIAMQESNLCKRIPEGSYNCLGFGIHSRGTLKFESFEANFDRAARELKANYIDQGRTTPEQIMKKYTPSSNGSWAASVNQWMAEMKYDDRKLGKTQKVNANVLEYVGDDSNSESTLSSTESGTLIQ